MYVRVKATHWLHVMPAATKSLKSGSPPMSSLPTIDHRMSGRACLSRQLILVQNVTSFLAPSIPACKVVSSDYPTQESVLPEQLKIPCRKVLLLWHQHGRRVPHSAPQSIVGEHRLAAPIATLQSTNNKKGFYS